MPDLVRIAWALEATANPAVLRLHSTLPLTEATITTCPPARPPAPLNWLLDLEEVRSIDLHPYRARLNLAPGVAAGDARSAVEAILRSAWGEPEDLGVEEPPRAFSVGAVSGSGRVVAESPQMAAAATEPSLRAVFEVEGVVEAILEEGVVQVRLGRLFRWAERERYVRAALASLRPPA